MKKLFVILVFTLPMFLEAQTSSGIKFGREMSWAKTIAKEQGKYVFVYCFNTSSEESKKMDDHVFNQAELGEYYNNKFICIKVQMDTTSSDSKLTKFLYPLAHWVKSYTNIKTYPAFLFYSPSGELVHKASGSMTAERFIELGNDAMDSTHQYYTSLTKVQPGQIGIDELRGLPLIFKDTDTSFAGKAAEDYVTRIPLSELGNSDNRELIAYFQNNKFVLNRVLAYLRSLSKSSVMSDETINLFKNIKGQASVAEFAREYLGSLDQQTFSIKGNLRIAEMFNNDIEVQRLSIQYIRNLEEVSKFTKDNLSFMVPFTTKSGTPEFDFFFKNASRIDFATGKKWFANDVVDQIVLKEDLNPLLELAYKSMTVPDWTSMHKAISDKYNKDVADRAVLYFKYKYWGRKTRTDTTAFAKFIEYGLARFIQHGMDTIDPSSLFSDFYINNFCWIVFQHSMDKDQLNSAAELMKQVEFFSKSKIPANTDFYTSAMDTYTKYLDTYANLLYKSGQVELALQLMEKDVKLSLGDPEIKEHYEKMKTGLPTW